MISGPLGFIQGRDRLLGGGIETPQLTLRAIENKETGKGVIEIL